MKYIFILLVWLTCSCIGFAQQVETEVEKAWQEFVPGSGEPVKEVLKKKAELAKRFKGDEKLLLQNKVEAVNVMAEQLREHKQEGIKPSGLKNILKDIDLSVPEVARIKDLSRFIENYYGLKFLSEGEPMPDVWGSMWFNTIVETIGNDYDYKRYEAVLGTGNPELITNYLECLTRVFRYNGYTAGLGKIRPLIEKNFPEGELKEQILDLYQSYYPLREGAIAPQFTLKDFRGKEHSLSDYRGRVVVIDIWATWCGGCMLKLPKFMEMREAYKGRQDVEFITISIDQSGNFKSWKYTLPRLKLLEVTNLLASPEVCTFGKDYNITGIPRYFVIDKEGKIASVYAPTPGEGMKKLIDKILNK